MRYKVKSLVGFYQCIAAISSVFNVTPPRGLEEFYHLINLLELPAVFEDLFIPSQCFGRYRTRLWMGSSWPIALLLAAASASMGWELAQELYKKDVLTIAVRGERAAWVTGLQRVVPLTLGLTFLLVPSSSTRIFKTFLCDQIEYAEGDMRRYLHDDLEISCDSDDYLATRDTAILFLLLWPCFVPALYALLLYASREAIITGVPTPLSRATTFLSGD